MQLSAQLLKREVKVGTLATVMARFDKGEGLACREQAVMQEHLFFLPSWTNPARVKEVAYRSGKGGCNITERSHRCGCIDYTVENQHMVRFPCSDEHNLHVSRPPQTDGRVMAGFFA